MVLGQVKWETRGRGRGARELLYGIPVWRVPMDPDGWLRDWRIKRTGKQLARRGLHRILVPGGFDRWELLNSCGLGPVDPIPFVRAQSAELAEAALERQGVAPDRAAVALCGLRADGALRQAAIRLCPRVKRLVIQAPLGGRELADWLRWEFGIPVAPAGERAQLALCFGPEEARREELVLRLYGSHPELAGLSVSAPALAEEDRKDLAVLTALWEQGRLPQNAIKIT